MSEKTVICWGELLWDTYGETRHAGGSPLNVAVHLRRMGFDARPVSAVGDDEAGVALIAAVKSFGLPTDFISVLPGIQTGHAGVVLDQARVPRFDIGKHVAWDGIPVSDALLKAAADASAIVWGSLAQRSTKNCDSLLELLEFSYPLKVMDVNLRAPHDDIDLTLDLARRAAVVKASEIELARLLGWDFAPDEEFLREGAFRIADLTGAGTICITAGANGAGLLIDGAWYRERGRTVDVVDTVGAGDAFLARLLAGLLDREDPRAILAASCRRAEETVGHQGAIPPAELGTTAL